MNALFFQHHQKFGITSAQQKQLDKLEAGAQVILTGQQPGIMGGPLYNLLKAFTALRECEVLEVQFPGQKFVPVFWIASDDSDLKECNFFESPFTGKNMSFTFEKSHQNLPMYLRHLEKHHIEAWNLWAKDHLEDFPTLTEQSLSDHFAQVLQNVFGERGLLFLDTSSQEFQDLSQDFLTKCATQNDSLYLILQKNAQLKQNQSVLLDPFKTRVFQKIQNQRIRLETHQKIEHPLMHDVLSRPLLASALLPIYAHILGPGELKYFELLEGAFELFHLKAPKALSRAFGHVLRSQDKHILSQLKLRYSPENPIHWDHIQNAALDLEYPEIKENVLYQNLEKPQNIPQEEWEKAQLQLMRKAKQIQQELLKKSLKKNPHFSQYKKLNVWLGQGRKQERVLFVLPYWDEILLFLERMEGSLVGRTVEIVLD
jgi:uncharacterized protein YllA (UPF0747 family)